MPKNKNQIGLEKMAADYSRARKMFGPGVKLDYKDGDLQDITIVSSKPMSDKEVKDMYGKFEKFGLLGTTYTPVTHPTMDIDEDSVKKVMQQLAQVSSETPTAQIGTPPRGRERQLVEKKRHKIHGSEKVQELKEKMGHIVSEDATEDAEAPSEAPSEKVAEAPSKKVATEELPVSQFIEEVKILFISGTDQRLICHFLGNASTSEIKDASEGDVTMISLIKMQALRSYMDSQGYTFMEEVNIDPYGNRIPTVKHTWMVGGKPVTFIKTGYLFFGHKSSDKKDNVVFYVVVSNDGVGSVTCFSSDEDKSGNLVSGLEDYAKKHNALRGVKMRDVNMIRGTYEEVVNKKEYTWDTFYYPPRVKALFDLEVFGFLSDTEKYNAEEITKRGILLHGQPGTGKTSIGYILCHYATNSTVLWITPDMVASSAGQTSIKMLYSLADYVSPAIIILEDIDLFSEDRENVIESTRLGTLMNILDGVDSVTNSVTVAMTNRIEFIEKALSSRPGRFDRVVEIPGLDKNLRSKMLESRLSDCFVEDDVMRHIVEETENWTGAQLQELVLTIKLYFIRDKITNKNVSMEIAKEAIDQIKSFSNTKANGQMGFHT